MESPVEYGGEFRLPSAKRLQRERNNRVPKLFNREEIQRMLLESNVHLSAMVHLGINAGFGNSDVATLPISAVNLESGWVDFPRPKTEVPRKVPLWLETCKGLRQSLAERPDPKCRENAGLFYLTKDGNPYVRMIEPTEEGKTAVPTDAVSMQFRYLMKRLEIQAKGLNFYTLRHVFETVAGESRDQLAVDAIMGHIDRRNMASNYRWAISDERLIAVVNVVRDWLVAAWEGGAA